MKVVRTLNSKKTVEEMRVALRKGQEKPFIERKPRLKLSFEEEIVSFVLAYRALPAQTIASFVRILPSDVEAILTIKKDSLFENTGIIQIPKIFPYIETALEEELAVAIAHPTMGKFLTLFFYNCMGVPIVPDFLDQIVYGFKTRSEICTINEFIERVYLWSRANWSNIYPYEKFPIPHDIIPAVLKMWREKWDGNRLLPQFEYGTPAYMSLSKILTESEKVKQIKPMGVIT